MTRNGKLNNINQRAISVYQSHNEKISLEIIPTN